MNLTSSARSLVIGVALAGTVGFTLGTTLTNDAATARTSSDGAGASTAYQPSQHARPGRGHHSVPLPGDVRVADTADSQDAGIPRSQVKGP